MTGFARVKTETAAGPLTVSLRSVNHRGLDLHFHLPTDLDPLEGAIRKALQAGVTRGHVDVRVSWKRAADAAPAQWNRPMLASWLRAFEEASREFGVESKPDLNSALRMPGMWSEENSSEYPPGFEDAVMGAVTEAVEILNQVREREGADLVAVLHGHAGRIREAATEIEASRADVVAAVKVRLEERVGELLASAAIDPARIAQEAALLADRSEVAEEIARLKIHSVQLDKLLDAGGDIGKKLEFLLQEMHRETNTILSKSNGGGEAGRRVCDLALGVKSEIEKIREQSLNLE
jgi:uncharacterized protein (TIGR00255 family)